MEQSSVYCIACVCGRHIETAKYELDCPACGRKLLIDWSAEIEELQAEEKEPAA